MYFLGQWCYRCPRVFHTRRPFIFSTWYMTVRQSHLWTLRLHLCLLTVQLCLWSKPQIPIFCLILHINVTPAASIKHVMLGSAVFYPSNCTSVPVVFTINISWILKFRPKSQSAGTEPHNRPSTVNTVEKVQLHSSVLEAGVAYKVLS